MNYWGCLNRVCCAKTVEFFDSYDWILITVIILLMICCFLGAAGALYSHAPIGMHHLCVTATLTSYADMLRHCVLDSACTIDN